MFDLSVDAAGTKMDSIEKQNRPATFLKDQDNTTNKQNQNVLQNPKTVLSKTVVTVKNSRNVFVTVDAPSTSYRPHRTSVGSFATQCANGSVVSSKLYKSHAGSKTRPVGNKTDTEKCLASVKNNVETANPNITPPSESKDIANSKIVSERNCSKMENDRASNTIDYVNNGSTVTENLNERKEKWIDATENACNMSLALNQPETEVNLKRHQLYLKAKQDLYMEEGKTCDRLQSDLNMMAELLPLSTVKNNIATYHTGETVVDNLVNIEKVESDSNETSSYSPTIEDFENYRQAVLKRPKENDIFKHRTENSPDINGCVYNQTEQKIIDNTTDTEKAFIATPITTEPFQSKNSDMYCDEETFCCANHGLLNLEATDENETLGTNMSYCSDFGSKNIDGEDSTFEDIVSDILSDGNLISSFSSNAPDITKEFTFQPNDSFGDLMPSIQLEDCMASPQVQDTKSEDNINKSADENCLPSVKEFKSSRTSTHFGKLRKYKFEKRLPASYRRAKPHKSKSIEKALYQAAEAFLGDFNDKDKRSCRDRPLGQRGQPETIVQTERKTSSRESSLDSISSRSAAKAEKNKKMVNLLNVKREKAEMPELRLTRKQAVEQKLVSNPQQEAIDGIKVSPEPKQNTAVMKAENKTLKSSTEKKHPNSALKHNERKNNRSKDETPRIPALKLSSVKKGKCQWKKTWSPNTTNQMKEKTIVSSKRKCSEQKKEMVTTKPKCDRKSDKSNLQKSHKKQNENPAKVTEKKKESNPKVIEKNKAKSKACNKQTNKLSESSRKKNFNKNEDEQSVSVFSRPSVEVLTCKPCGFKTTNRDGMVRHYQFKHKEWCSKCVKQFKSVVSTWFMKTN